MRNKFGGTCYQCGTWVKPGDGHFERFKGKWIVQHATCCIENRQMRLTRDEARAKLAKDRAENTGGDGH